MCQCESTCRACTRHRVQSPSTPKGKGSQNYKLLTCRYKNLPIEPINHTHHSETASQGRCTNPQHPGFNAPYLAETTGLNMENFSFTHLSKARCKQTHWLCSLCDAHLINELQKRLKVDGNVTRERLLRFTAPCVSGISTICTKHLL